MASTTAPDVGMLVGIPGGRRLRYGLLDLLPTLKASAFEGQRLEGLPLGLNQVYVRSIRGLKDELPARIRQVEEQDIDSPMHG